MCCQCCRVLVNSVFDHFLFSRSTKPLQTTSTGLVKLHHGFDSGTTIATTIDVSHTVVENNTMWTGLLIPRVNWWNDDDVCWIFVQWYSFYFYHPINILPKTIFRKILLHVDISETASTVKYHRICRDLEVDAYEKFRDYCICE